MPQPDRQTDKSTWWSVTAYNSEIELLETTESYPAFVLKVYGGRETCPETGRLHFQGALHCRSQQRMSAIKKWLPTAHLEQARSDEAIKKYAMKLETAAGDKIVRQSSRVYLSMSDALTIIGKYNMYVDPIEYSVEHNCKDSKDALKSMYWDAVRTHLEEDKYDDISLFSQPQMISAWSNTSTVWKRRAIVLQARQDMEKMAATSPISPGTEPDDNSDNISVYSIETDASQV